MSTSPDSAADTSSCAARTITGLTTGVAAAVVAAGVVVAWKGPSARLSPIQRFRQLMAILAPAGAIVGGVFSFGECAAETARNRVDMWNPMIGGCAAGITVGMHRRSLASAAFGCMALGAAGALTDSNKYMFASPQTVAKERMHSDDLQTSANAVDNFAASEFRG